MRQMELYALAQELGHHVLHQAPASQGRFPDGSRYRVEIPSCEGPTVMQAVLDEAAARGSGSTACPRAAG